MKIFCAFMIYYYICSILCVVVLWKKFHNEENKEKLENDLARFVGDTKRTFENFTREDALVGFYLAAIFFSFIVVPIVILNKFLKIIGIKNA